MEHDDVRLVLIQIFGCDLAVMCDELVVQAPGVNRSPARVIWNQARLGSGDHLALTAIVRQQLAHLITPIAFIRPVTSLLELGENTVLIKRIIDKTREQRDSRDEIRASFSTRQLIQPRLVSIRVEKITRPYSTNRTQKWRPRHEYERDKRILKARAEIHFIGDQNESGCESKERNEIGNRPR